MKFDFVKNRVLFISICIFLATVLVLLSVWKQQTPTIEGMIVMDFLTPSQTEEKKDEKGNTIPPRLTDMDLQNYSSSLIPFQKKFETLEKAKATIKIYNESFNYDPSGNEIGDVNMDGISASNLENFIKSLDKTTDSFKNFSEAIKKMKKDKMDEYIQRQQGTTASASSGATTGSSSSSFESSPTSGTTGSGTPASTSGSGSLLSPSR